MECFQNARRSLIEYLKMVYAKGKAENSDFLMSATYQLVDRSQNSDSDLTGEYKLLFSTPKDAEMVFNCISFNYTPIFDEGKNELISNAQGISNAYGRPSKYEVGDILNVHGTLNDFPILGVDNVMQIANEAFREDDEIVQMMVKGEIDKKLGYNWRREAIRIIEKSDKIYVYGASLGDSDEFWWRTLAQWFEADDQHELALYCHPEKNEAVMNSKIESFLDSIAKHFKDQNLKLKMAVDITEKNMKVKFAHMSAQSEIRLTTIARLSVETVSEREENHN